MCRSQTPPARAACQSLGHSELINVDIFLIVQSLKMPGVSSASARIEVQSVTSVKS